jgi:diacylglycerol kinase family enzyme
MHYAIITNPVSGKMTVDQKRAVLAKAAEILDAEIYGLDAITADDFGQCARELATHYDVLVTAGGDGTFSDIINSIDTAQTPISYLPLGTGNAMRYALEYKGSLADIAMRIRDAKIQKYDLINCDEKKRAFMASIGIEGTLIRLRNQYLTQGATGFKTYLCAAFNAYFREYKRANATITVDDATFEAKNLLSLMVVKQPYYGFRMNVVPMARFDDRKLHILYISSGLFKCAIGGATAFTIGNRIGEYRTGQKLAVQLERPLILQIDGNNAWDADNFSFTVMPNALKIKC